jgi:hypothetical protein
MLKKTDTDVKQLRQISLKSGKNDGYCIFSVRPGDVNKMMGIAYLVCGQVMSTK